MTTDLARIERKTLIRAPRSRVWKAISDLEQFSAWFRVKAEGVFQPGARVRMTSTYKGHEGTVFYLTIDEISPEHRFSWRWNPHSELPPEDTTAPATVVEFRLEDADGGTLVTVTESGFDRVDPAHRAKAFADNSEGWKIQMENLSAYVGKTA
jgi:uncharacterized protein YndB with AHSA1/START domain